MSGEGLGERILRAHLREPPFHRAITRSIEARIPAEIEFPRPMLDIRSGDGHFASVAVALRSSSGTFDSALSSCVLEHTPDLDTTLAEVAPSLPR